MINMVSQLKRHKYLFSLLREYNIMTFRYLIYVQKMYNIKKLFSRKKREKECQVHYEKTIK